MNTQTLPFLPSALATVAIRNFKSILRQPRRFEVDMEGWVQPSEDGRKCAVCFGGAVMVKSLKVAVDEGGHPSELDFPEVTVQRLYALDHYRQGQFESAFNYLGIDWERTPEDMRDELDALSDEWEQFHDTDSETFVAQCEEARDILKDYGY